MASVVFLNPWHWCLNNIMNGNSCQICLDQSNSRMRSHDKMELSDWSIPLPVYNIRERIHQKLQLCFDNSCDNMSSLANTMKMRSKLSLKKRTRDRAVQTKVDTFGAQVAVLAREVDVLKQLHEEVWDHGNGSITPEDLEQFHHVAAKLHQLIRDSMEEGVTPSQSKFDNFVFFHSFLIIHDV